MTIRVKLTMASIAVVVLANSLVSFFTVRRIGKVWLQEVQMRIRLDLNSAREAYQNHLRRMAGFMEAVALDCRVIAAVANGDEPGASEYFADAYAHGGMDILAVLDKHGRVRHRVQSPVHRGDDLAGNPVVRSALETEFPSMGTVVLSPEELRREGSSLAERARFSLLPTPAARPTDDEVRAAGMVLAVAVPVFSEEDELCGLLYGGDLLNRRYEIVDAIKREVFPHQLHAGREVGTVTIFQGDLRISTNVLDDDGQRAVGTRLSDAVYERVLEQGEIWADRAFVVNDWYITAYEPIRDPGGRVIGALYVGQLEAPFLQHQRAIVGPFLGMMILTTVTSLSLIFLVTKLVLNPIGRIIIMARKVIQGDLSARVEIRPPGEMGRLCRAIDAMADAVRLREAQLKLATQKRIGRTEQLASIGRLSAGIAHEINNPLTGVLTFAHLLHQKGNLTEEDKEDLAIIIRETTRVSEIVRGLLDFARERPSKKELLHINDVIEQTLRLIRSQKRIEQIAIGEELAEDLPPVNGDANQLQQVLLNLALNACEAMPDGGTLTVRSEMEGDKIVIEVIDTGCGIPKEHIDHIFDPFFSTKPVGKGTGLGLSVSYGIIHQHGGNLEVDSTEGKGTTLTVILPLAGDAAGGREPEEGDR